jgi:hypothetical protein
MGRPGIEYFARRRHASARRSALHACLFCINLSVVWTTAPAMRTQAPGGTERMSDDKRAHLDKVVARILEDLTKRYNKDGRDVAAKFKDDFGETMWSHTKWAQILKSNPEAIKAKDKLTLVAAARVSSIDNLFEYAFTKTHDLSVANLNNDYDGHYRYWRYYPGGRHAPQLRWGLIRIHTTPDSHTAFKHWSYDVLSGLDIKHRGDVKAILNDLPSLPEDEGIVIYTSFKIFMIGFRRLNIRLSIANLAKQPSLLDDQSVKGIVLTNKDSKQLYSAAFIMFKETNEDFFFKKITPKIFDEHTKSICANRSKLVLYEAT